MAFPGTYNINYYKGDTFEFNIFPKTSSNEPFSLTDYDQIRFTISNVRGPEVEGGPAKVTINGYAAKKNNLNILCAITPENGAAMVAGTPYYYDVEIAKIASPYDYIYTLLQGTITVSEETTLPATLPGLPQNLVINSLTLNAGSISWSPPTGTTPISAYNIYVVINNIPVLKLGTVSGTTTTFTTPFVPPLSPDQSFTVGVRAENTSGEGAMATVTGTTPSS